MDDREVFDESLGSEADGSYRVRPGGPVGGITASERRHSAPARPLVRAHRGGGWVTDRYVSGRLAPPSRPAAASEDAGSLLSCLVRSAMPCNAQAPKLRRQTGRPLRAYSKDRAALTGRLQQPPHIMTQRGVRWQL